MRPVGVPAPYERSIGMERTRVGGDRRAVWRASSAADGTGCGGRGESLPVLLRCALHAGLSDAYRCAGFHQEDRERQSCGIGEDDSRRQHLGASCARVCPVEVLCEGACVMQHYNREPIEIGLLQRHAMDAFAGSGLPLPFSTGVPTGWSVALLGAGPASLACAAELRRRGVAATLYDASRFPVA